MSAVPFALGPAHCLTSVLQFAMTMNTTLKGETDSSAPPKATRKEWIGLGVIADLFGLSAVA